MTPGNDRRTIVTFTIIAFLILGMACVNFTNLATARASQRAREVALRKVLGANRQQLITQFLAESVLIAGIAMLLALALVELLLPALAAFLDADLQMRYFGWDGMLLPILGLTLLVGAAGGVYPAFYLSRFQPAQVLKANKSSAEAAGSGRLRNVLVDRPVRGLDRADHLHGRRLRADRLRAHGRSRLSPRRPDPGRESRPPPAARARATRSPRKCARVPGVVSVGRSGIGVATSNNNNTGVQVPGQHRAGQHRQLWRRSAISSRRWASSWSPAGCSTRTGRPTDSTCPSRRRPEAASAALVGARRQHRHQRAGGAADGLPAPRRRRSARPSASPSSIRRTGSCRPGSSASSAIRASARSASRSIRSCSGSIRAMPAPLLIRYDGRDPQGVRARVEQAWKRLAPDVPFDGEFSEDRIAELYKAEEARAKVFAGFAMLAVIVACLGLFGLAAFTAERRTKEIGIRKVLGARTRDIVRLLAWQFSKPVIIANLIAWPVAWWVMRDWLQQLRRAHRSRRRRPFVPPACSRWRSRSAPSPATPSRWRAPIRSSRCDTNDRRFPLRRSPARLRRMSGGGARRPCKRMLLMMASALILAATAFGITAMLCLAATRAWKGWLELRRLEIASRAVRGGEAAEDGVGVRIELADVRERLKKLEAIASGVEL